jgi:acetyl esterase
MPLDPEIAAYLESQKGLPPRSALSIAETRVRIRAAAALAGPAREMARVDDFDIREGLRARQYWPASDATLAVLVYFHGGRFISGDLDSHDPLCRSLAAAAGCRVVAVDYGLAPEHRFPSAADDATAAVEWALRQGVPVGVAGDSAGGNLAAVAALKHRRAGLACQVLVYPMMDATCAMLSHVELATGYGPGSDDMRRGWREYAGSGADARDPRLSPVFATDVAGAAPAMIVLAEYDTLRDEGEAYARRLADAGVPTTVRLYEGTIHGFFAMAGVFGIARDAVFDVCGFVTDRLITGAALCCE